MVAKSPAEETTGHSASGAMDRRSASFSGSFNVWPEAKKCKKSPVKRSRKFFIKILGKRGKLPNVGILAKRFSSK
jgi:hypothetical protein